MELKQIEALLSKASLTSGGIQEWRNGHEDLLDHVLKGPKLDSPSDSDSDIEGQDKTNASSTSTVNARENGGNEIVASQNVADGMSETSTARTLESEGSTGEHCNSQTEQSPAMLEVSGMARSSPVHSRPRAGSVSSETSF